MSDRTPSHQTMDIEHVRRDLHSLHGQIVRNWGRVEITRQTEDEERAGTCVMISKAELDCIERALEILHESPAGQKMHTELEQLAGDCISPAQRESQKQPVGATRIANQMR